MGGADSDLTVLRPCGILWRLACVSCFVWSMRTVEAGRFCRRVREAAPILDWNVALSQVAETTGLRFSKLCRQPDAMLRIEMNSLPQRSFVADCRSLAVELTALEVVVGELREVKAPDALADEGTAVWMKRLRADALQRLCKTSRRDARAGTVPKARLVRLSRLAHLGQCLAAAIDAYDPVVTLIADLRHHVRPLEATGPTEAQTVAGAMLRGLELALGDSMQIHGFAQAFDDADVAREAMVVLQRVHEHLP